MIPSVKMKIATATVATDRELGFNPPRHMGGNYPLNLLNAKEAWAFINERKEVLERELEQLTDISLLLEDGLMLREQRDYWREQALELKEKLDKNA